MPVKTCSRADAHRGLLWRLSRRRAYDNVGDTELAEHFGRNFAA